MMTEPQLTLLWPFMLIFLLLIPPGILLYLRLQQRRRRLAESFSSLGVGQIATGRSDRRGFRRRHLPPLLFLIGVTVLILALARPHTLVHLPRVEGTVILLFDVSGSMAADDFQPTRMEAAKAAAREFVLSQPESVKVGVVAFSDSGFAVQAPTNRQEIILATIDRLKPQRGTSLAHGVIASLNTIATDAGLEPPEVPTQASDQPDENALPLAQLPEGTFPYAVIVMLSDGENNEDPDPLEAAQVAADRKVRIHTVGIGSPEGTILEVEGFSVHTRLDEALLREMADRTGGAYHNAENEEELKEVYSQITPQLIIRPEQTEVTALFAGASLLILLISGVLSMVWLGRVP